MESINYKVKQSFSVLIEASPVPTTEVAEMGLRFNLASIRKLAVPKNILGGILLRTRNMSMILGHGITNLL
jgi:hypothetical protein